MQPLDLHVGNIEVQGESGLSRKGVNYLYRSWQWLSDQLVQNVPDEYAVCEFVCRKQYCSADDRKKCELRLR